MAQSQSGGSGDMLLIAVLRASMEKKTGVTVYLRGQTIAMVVTSIGDNFVEGRNQQSSRIVVRLASIDAAVAV